MFATLFLILVSAQVQAAECKIDKVTLTEIKTLLPAGGLDAFSVGAIRELIAGAATGASGANTFVNTKLLASGIKYAFEDLLDDKIAEFDQNFISTTDQLIVRINGVRAVPVSLADKFYPMEKGDIYPAQVSGFTLGTSTVQILEYDSASDNDDLGSLEIFDESMLSEPVEPLNEDTVFVIATNDEDDSVYKVSYKLEPNVGNLDDVPERIICGRDECVDAREPLPKTFAISELYNGLSPMDCPAGYDLDAYTSEEISSITDNELFAVCELHPDIATAANPDECGSSFDPVFHYYPFDFPPGITSNDLKDGDIITLKSENLKAVSGGQYLSSRYGQYLALCPDCFLAPGPDAIYLTQEAAFAHVLDPNRASAQWVVKRLSNGKIALQGENGKYLSGCNDCVGSSGYNAFVNVTNPTNNPLAQFTFENGISQGSFKLKIGDTLSLTPLPLALEGEGDIDYIGYRYAANFPLVPAERGKADWQISILRPDIVSAASYAGSDPDALSFAFAEDISVKSTEIWEISAGQVLTIDNGTTLTVEGGAKLVNYGTIINNGFLKVGDLGEITNFGIIVNKEAILIRDGVIQNTTEFGSDKKAVIDNSQANYFQNLGTLNNEGYIYDPLTRLKGNNPKINPASSGYYLAGGIFGERACRLMSGNDVSWNAGSRTCSIESLWLLAGQTLEIRSGLTLEVNGAFNNDGEIINNGLIDNSNGIVRQCGSYGPNGIGTRWILNLSAFIEDCTPPPEQTKCEAYGGTFVQGVNANTGVCTNPLGPVPAGQTLAIPSGVTWIVGSFTNSGAINIEQGGAMEVVGGFTNRGNGIINYGLFSVGFDQGFAVPFTFTNDNAFINYGTINNSGDIVGDGFINNFCGSSYNLIRNFGTDPWANPFDPEGQNHPVSTTVCIPPDSDADGVSDDQDIFPNDITQSEDRDGDGFGDNLNGNLPDLFPDNKFEHADSDGDCAFLPVPADPGLAGQGCGDNSDAFPNNNMEQADSDFDCGYRKPDPGALLATSGNGCGDSSFSDQFPLNPLEIMDTDGDCGFILEQTTVSGNGCGDSSDDFINGQTQTRDSDGDGLGDDPAGNSPDRFIYDPENTKLISVGNVNGWRIGSALFSSAARDDVMPPGLPAGVELPYGIFSVVMAGGTIGTESTIIITYPAPLDPGTVWWKYGKSTVNPDPHWYVFDGAVIAGKTVTLSITDGGTGDDDLIANGKISDPGGPGSSPPDATDSSGASGGGGSFSLKLLFAMMCLMLIRFRTRQVIRR